MLLLDIEINLLMSIAHFGAYFGYKHLHICILSPYLDILAEVYNADYTKFS